MYRLRAFVLLLSFAIGSLIARDALFIHQVMTIAAGDAAFEDAPDDDSPAFEQAPPKVKGRPKGISRRMAWSPWDPPDDDDEMDDDSDSIAVGHVRLAVLPAAPCLVLEAEFVPVRALCAQLAPTPCVTSLRPISERGPPV